MSKTVIEYSIAFRKKIWNNALHTSDGIKKNMRKFHVNPISVNKCSFAWIEVEMLGKCHLDA